jgi:hypothetical protein
MKVPFVVSRRVATNLRSSARTCPFNTMQKAYISKTASITNPNIKVTHFEDGKRVHENVHIEATSAQQTIVGDVPYVATGLKAATRDTLPTTLKNFTLTGKTAIVSGYVTPTSTFISPSY